MFLSWHGYSCVLVEGKGKEAGSVLLDPFGPDGKALKRASDQLVVLTRPAEKSPELAHAAASPPRLVASPGEYDIRGVAIHATAAERDPLRLAVSLTVDGLVVLHLAGLSRAPTQAFLEQFEEVDILTIPVGGGDGLTPSAAAEIARAIEPHVLIPLRYRTDTLPKGYESVSAFLKEMGSAPAATPESRMKLERDEVRALSMRLMVLRDASV